MTHHNIHNIHNIHDVTDDDGAVIAPAWLTRAERVHRQLRPQLGVDYAGELREVFRGGGRMSVAATGDDVTGVAIFRVYANTAEGRHLYVDDLVTDEVRRSSGVGKALLDHLHEVARAQGCRTLKLDSGTHRQQAHKFYFREGMTIVAFHFKKPLA